MDFEIIQDTREKLPIKFDCHTIIHKLDTGDYTINGYESKFCIERKASIGEFYNSILQKRFWAELDRMKEYPHRYLILEFPILHIDTFPHSLKLPKRIWSKIRVSPKYIYSCLNKIQYDYQVIALFVGNREKSAKIMTDIMARYYESQTLNTR